MKRFYQSVDITKETENRYGILLDNKPVQTPLKKKLTVSTRKLAEIIAKEWQEQKVSIVPSSMPFTQLSTTYLDKVAGKREEIFLQIEPYIHGDTIFYWKPEDPELYKWQEEKWGRIITNIQDYYKIELFVQKSLLAIDQSTKTIEAVRKWLESLPKPEMLNAFQSLVSITASPFLSMLWMDAYITKQELYELSFLEELYQIEKWGSDPESRRNQQIIQQDIEHIEKYLKIIQIA